MTQLCIKEYMDCIFKQVAAYNDSLYLIIRHACELHNGARVPKLVKKSVGLALEGVTEYVILGEVGQKIRARKSKEPCWIPLAELLVDKLRNFREPKEEMKKYQKIKRQLEKKHKRLNLSYIDVDWIYLDEAVIQNGQVCIPIEDGLVDIIVRLLGCESEVTRIQGNGARTYLSDDKSWIMLDELGIMHSEWSKLEIQYDDYIENKAIIQLDRCEDGNQTYSQALRSRRQRIVWLGGHIQNED